MYSLSHIGIRCQDLDRSLHFYVNARGGTRGREYRMPSGSHLVFVNFDGFSIELICKPNDTRVAGTNHLAIDVPSMDAALKRLNENGVAVSGDSVAPMGDHALNCFLKGPDGEIIELCQGSL